MSTGNLNDLGFNANDVPPQSFDVLPPGQYEVAIVGSIVQATKKGDGKLLALELEILDGEHKGRKLFDRLNLWNPNPKAQEIARATLSAICRAVGVLTPGDSTELHNRALVAKVAIRKSDEYGDQNEIRGYYQLSGRRRDERVSNAPDQQDIPF